MSGWRLPNAAGEVYTRPTGLRGLYDTTAFGVYCLCRGTLIPVTHKMGILRQTMFDSNSKKYALQELLFWRMLWDNSMANKGQNGRENPSGLLVSIVGADHVKFGGRAQ